MRVFCRRSGLAGLGSWRGRSRIVRRDRSGRESNLSESNLASHDVCAAKVGSGLFLLRSTLKSPISR